MSKRDQVLEAIAEHVKVKKDSLNDSTDLKDDLGLDSLDVVELTLQLEESCGVTIPDDKLQNVKTIGDLVKVVDDLTK